MSPELRALLQKARLYAVVGGVGLVALALFADPLGISSAGFSRGQMILLAVGAALGLLGVLGGRVVRAYQVAGVMLLNTLVVLVLFEVFSGGVLWLISDEEAQDILDSNVEDWRSLPYYAAQDWSEGYWAEAAGLDVVYHAFSIWRSKPVTGEYINTNAEGIRQPPSPSCPAPYTVFAFGGSTMWGAGSPDFGTIPAQMSLELQHRLRQGVCVVNFGQTAFVTTQGVIELLLQLQQGNVPDLVIFYSGINDVQSAYESGHGDLHQNYQRIADLYNHPTTEAPFDERLVEELKANTYSVALLDKLFSHTVEEITGGEVESYATMGVDFEALADETVKTFLGSMEIVEKLAAGYGFEYAFFWQPVIAIGEKPLTPEEAVYRERMDDALVVLYEAVYSRIEETAIQHENLYYIADALDDEEEQIWIDEFHVTPAGNTIIMQVMVEALWGR